MQEHGAENLLGFLPSSMKFGALYPLHYSSYSPRFFDFILKFNSHDVKSTTFWSVTEIDNLLERNRISVSPLQDRAHEILVMTHTVRWYLGLLTLQSEDRQLSGYSLPTLSLTASWAS